MRPWTGWIVVALATFVAGWLVFDHMHGVLTGDYVTPNSGAHAGQLGPWPKLPEALGIDHRSQGMMAFHISFGTAWPVTVLGFVWGKTWGERAVWIFAVAGMWNAPVGTVLGVIQIGLLLFGRRER